MEESDPSDRPVRSMAKNQDEVTIPKALEQLGAGKKVTDRTTGFENLKYLLQSKRRNATGEKIKDKGYHKIFETLFYYIKIERTRYNRLSRSGTSQTTAGGKLSLYASALRFCVECGLPTIRSKTVKALVDHILQTLPGSDQKFCEPLAPDYVKTLATVLQFPPHVEHLPKDDWCTLVDFCNVCIQSYVDSSEGHYMSFPSVASRSEVLPARTSHLETPSSLVASLGNGCKSTLKNEKSEPKKTVEEIVYCLRDLMSTSNAPVSDKAQETAQVLLMALVQADFVIGAQHAMFSTINYIITRMSTEDILLARKTFRESVPIIRRLWTLKSAALKEEMLATMIYGEPLLSGFAQAKDLEDIKTDMQGLYDCVQKEYRERPPRDQLQVDDLDLSGIVSRVTARTMPLALKSFALRSGNMKSEPTWALLHNSASIFIFLHNDPFSDHGVPNIDDFNIPKKRRRITRPIDQLTEPLRPSSAPQTILVALQVLAFVLDRTSFDAKSIQTVLEPIIPFVSGEDNYLSNWAMLAMACAVHSQSSSILGPNIWAQVWRLAARNISSVPTCRAASYLMTLLLELGLVHFADVADIVDTMFSSVDLNGPATFTDSAANLWSIIIKLKGRQCPSLIYNTAERVLGWLFIRWKPSHIQDRHRILYLSQHCQAQSIILLLSSVLSMPNPVAYYQAYAAMGTIGHAQIRCSYNKALIDYLILANNETGESLPGFGRSHHSEIKLLDARLQNHYNMVFDFLNVEIATLLKSDLLADSAGTFTLTADIVYIMSSTCIIAFGLLSQSQSRESSKAQQLRTHTDQLCGDLKEAIFRQDDPLAVADGIVSSIGPLLGSLDPTVDKRNHSLTTTGAIIMASSLGLLFWQQLQPPTVETLERGHVDEERSLKSQESLIRENSTSTSISHDWVCANTDPRAHRASLVAKICLIAAIYTDESGTNSKLLPESFIEYMTSLTPHDFLSTRPFLRDLLQSKMNIDQTSGSMLLDYIGQELLVPYELNACEVSWGVGLDILARLTDLWTDPENGAIAEKGGDLYEWYIKWSLQLHLSSPHAQLCLSAMLQRVIKFRPEYATDLSLPSARTSLFEILEMGNTTVKYNVGISISDIFGLFVLKEHDAILEDIISSLPDEGDWVERMALRLFVLAHLGSSWSTLLRRCIYAIFETAARVPNSTAHAKHCLEYVSCALKLENSRKLFKFFVSQIMYTWLETEGLRMIPYRIFGYQSLGELLRDVQDEVVGQIIMRGKDDEAQLLANELSQPYPQLLEVSFSKAAAYCIARDAAVPPSHDVQGSGADSRLRNALGKERYSSLISFNFPAVFAVFFNILDQEDHIIKGFQKHVSYSAAREAYNEILQLGASNTILPVTQQPCFKAAYLVDEIQYLFSRSNYDSEAAWSPALYVFVFREMLNTIHAALGSLHACSVIRRLRILICIAGKTALQDYSVEMALHSLRPFLTDTYCAEDTMGLFQYLLTHSVGYLQQAPSFFAGLAVSTLASMQQFLRRPQESTTQESQYRTTMTKAQTFYVWLGDFATRYTSPHLTGSGEAAFASIVRSARQLRDTGNARRGSHESELLLQLLEDRRSGRMLIDEPSQGLILDILIANFEAPPDPRDDLLGSDELAALYASALWSTCNRKGCGPGYLLWLGRVIGRAYAGAGFIDPNILREVDVEKIHGGESRSLPGERSSSIATLLRFLRDILLTDSREDVGTAERILQTIVSKSRQANLLGECERIFREPLLTALVWKPFHCPVVTAVTSQRLTLQEAAVINADTDVSAWARRVCISLTDTASDDPLISELKPILSIVTDLPKKMFPYIVHLVLLRQIEAKQVVKRILSDVLINCIQDFDKTKIPYLRLLLHTVLYLRTQPLPHESTKADRSQWLDFDHVLAAEVASKCAMYKTALLLLEVGLSNATKVRTSRRSSGIKVEVKDDLLIEIYQNLDDKDSFYGIRQPSSLSTMMEQLEYENAAFKGLYFRGAYYDSQLRQSGSPSHSGEEAMVQVLDTLDLNGLSRSLLSNMNTTGPVSAEIMLRTARKLEQWDISGSAIQSSEAGTVFGVFQDLQVAENYAAISSVINEAFSSTLNCLIDRTFTNSSVYKTLSTLAVLAEIEEVMSSKSFTQLQEAWNMLELRHKWMLSDRVERSGTILSCRETLFSSLSKRNNLRKLLKTSHREARTIECRALLASSTMSRHHGALQSALANATYLSHLVEPCLDLGMKIDAAVRLEGANVLWDQEEMSASIRLLQDILSGKDLASQTIPVSKPELLAKLGHRISEARLEKPDEIITAYLVPALKELNGATDGSDAGQVFHEFAAFCDQQLQNSDNLEDFQRIERLRERKETEVRDLDRMIHAAESQTKQKELKIHRTKAKQWLELDDREFNRLRDSRQSFLRQSLENYLLCLKACDNHDTDALRFAALWLKHYDDDIANTAVAKHIDQVGSGKFASLMNQWTSRLLDSPNEFQTVLSALVLRICIDHPYHGMYQIFASSKTKGGKDQAALARFAAANSIVNRIKASKRAAHIWLAIHNSSISFIRFSVEKLDESSAKTGSKVPLRKLPTGQKLEHDVPALRIPPPTMNIELRPDCNYSDVPVIAKFQPEFTLASGISMPKILVAIASNGRKYKQLFKSGNDDLRQDSIMEQVFAQVSNLLRSQRATRQRALGIRTYKVLPLTSTSGIIEFVSNTIPLHDYLMPAHQRHFAHDLKPNVCRKMIQEAQSRSIEARVTQFRSVCEKFHPVLKYFFMERFENPDDWFEKRLAYTRSTAAISILGYILGLGDRHGHNILLDETTGEVVHIDLGIAFEQGRVLPVPEVVPFRLTRDIVDGMGITKTEGCFRRCCEFTLRALRNEAYSIMTILDVLRYDPLYSWSISPLRLRKLQDRQAADLAEGDELAGGGKEGIGDRDRDEPGEADRALIVVGKKLSKSLSVPATVNELIQMATDEKNLALLFCGWAAYA